MGSVISGNTDTGVPRGDLGVMTPGQRLVSENGGYYALIDGNGTLVVRKVGDNGVDRPFNLEMGNDGILHLLDPTTNDELWNTVAGTIGRPEQNA